MEEANFQRTAEQVAAFQKIWMDSATQLLHAAMTGANSGSPPPEVARQMREGIFRALAASWDEFLRSPQFLESMKEWIESAVNFRKLTNELLGKARNEAQAPSREDIDAILVNVRHLEQRMLDTLDRLMADIAEIKARLQTTTPRPVAPPPARGAGRKPPPARTRKARRSRINRGKPGI